MSMKPPKNHKQSKSGEKWLKLFLILCDCVCFGRSILDGHMGDNYKDKEGAILTLEVNWYSYIYKISFFLPVVVVVVNVEGGTQNKSNVIGGSHNIDENWPTPDNKVYNERIVGQYKIPEGSSNTDQQEPVSHIFQQETNENKQTTPSSFFT